MVFLLVLCICRVLSVGLPLTRLSNPLPLMTVTLTTVGYGDLSAHNATTKMFACVYILIGVAMIGALLAKLVESLLDQQASWSLPSTCAIDLGTSVFCCPFRENWRKTLAFSGPFLRIFFETRAGSSAFRWSAVRCAVKVERRRMGTGPPRVRGFPPCSWRRHRCPCP